MTTATNLIAVVKNVLGMTRMMILPVDLMVWVQTPGQFMFLQASQHA